MGRLLGFSFLSLLCALAVAAGQFTNAVPGGGSNLWTLEVHASDVDGVADSLDAFSSDTEEDVDTDGDGIGDDADTDDDNDGIPDTFEIDHNLSPLTDDAGEDADGDGATNLQEYQAGTDPNDAASIDACHDSSAVAPLAEDSSFALERVVTIANPGSNVNKQSLLRIINDNDATTSVEIYGIDDGGRRSAKGPVSFSLAPQAAILITAQDIENGHADLAAKLCDGQGKWQLRVRSDNAVEIMGLIRTPDGFLTSLNDVAPDLAGDKMLWFGNPASNTRRQTFLRIVNLSEDEGTVSITGVDDEGIDQGTVSFTLGALAARHLTAQELETGTTGLTGKLADGEGKWRFRVSSARNIEAMSLIRTEDGFLSNLSSVVEANGNDHVVYFANPASVTAQQTLLRIINNSDNSDTVTITGIDDNGGIAPLGSVSFTLGANKSRQITIDDLENGHPDLMGMLGDGEGRWRLTVSAPGLDLRVMSLIRTENGFLTNLSRTTPMDANVNTAWMLNPASNINKRSVLRLVNNSSAQGSVTISGIDDDGNPGADEVTFNIIGDRAMQIAVTDLENGNSEMGLVGTLGNGGGKWRLRVSSDVDLTVQSLLETPAGFLTNLSGTINSAPTVPAEQTVATDSTIALSRTLALRNVVDAEDRDAVCNDGSDAAYYYDAGSGDGEDNWIVYLEGGSLCFSANSCLVRAATTPDLTSSLDYPDTISANGIFVADESVNPDFHNWHLVYARYCSSDLWSGRKEGTSAPGEFHFRGYDILIALLEDLQDESEFGARNLGNANELLFAGSSAGAGGVIVQLDRVASMLASVQVKGFVDALFYDPEVKDFRTLFDLAQQIAFQGSVLDDTCLAGESDTSLCGEPMTALQYIETPFYVVADQSDPVINGFFLQADPADYAAGVRQAMTALGFGFSPDAAVHVWLNDSLFYRYRISGMSPLDTFSNWYFGRSGVKLLVQQP